jgi:NADH:ubiquinone oxidoreductase subunit E
MSFDERKCVVLAEKTICSASMYESVREVLDKYGSCAHRLVPILQEIQEIFSYLPKDAMNYIATALGVSPGSVYGVATFYSHFTLEPKGKHIIRVCDGTACHVKKSEEIIKVIENDLGLDPKNRTSADMLFTLEVVACIGACGLAPVLTIGEDVFGAMNAEKMSGLLKTYIDAEKGEQ